jgi:hypothetical protein
LDHLMLTHMETMHKATIQQMMTHNSHMESTHLDNTTCSTYMGTKANIQPCNTHMEIKTRLAQHTWKSDHHSTRQLLNQQSMISAIKHKI